MHTKTTEFIPATLTAVFRVEDHGRKVHLFCKKCGAGWSLRKPEKPREVSAGNALMLLEHATSHK